MVYEVVAGLVSVGKVARQVQKGKPVAMWVAPWVDELLAEPPGPPDDHKEPPRVGGVLVQEEGIQCFNLQGLIVTTVVVHSINMKFVI